MVRLSFATDFHSGARIALFHPRQDAWDMHFRWSDDHLYIIALTLTGYATVDALEMNRPRIVELRKVWLKLGYVL